MLWLVGGISGSDGLGGCDRACGAKDGVKDGKGDNNVGSIDA